MSTATDFALTGPLPSGTTLLEASAGTGKTQTIASLAVRYIAEGHATVDQLLMITFGRNATRELRERVRQLLVQTRDALAAPHPEQSENPVVALLARDPGAGVAGQRIALALADFDAATIATTHQFCQQTLAGLGLSGDRDPGETFAEDIRLLVDEVVTDLYVAMYHRPRDGVAPLRLADAHEIGRAVIEDPQADLEAGPTIPDSADDLRVRFARAVRQRVRDRLRAARLVTFDDLVLRLADALTDPVTGPAACDRLRRAYRVVLVDEFQDTDPAQWRIVHTAFHGHRTVILIGDPKQAIYACRGADVHSYLDAAEVADQRATLPTNWRSDGPVVDGVAELLGATELGDPRIVVRPITARRVDSRLTGLPDPRRVRLRHVIPTGGDRPASVNDVRRLISADVAADVVDLLSGPGRLHRPSSRTNTPLPPEGRPTEPGDIAVLVANNKQADLIRAALAERSVPAVSGGVTSVFATPAAAQWRDLLGALEAPRGRWIRPAALTDFIGCTADDLATGGSALDEQVATTLRRWSQILAEGGVAALVAVIEAESGVLARVLSRPDGERTLTDLRHLASALAVQQRQTGWGVTALLDWLQTQAQRSAEDSREQTVDRTRRLESDADAVQVLTIHRSKGLEFPVTYVPFGWDRYEHDPSTITCHDGGRRILDVRSNASDGVAGHRRAMRAEESGESLRLLYVALTRASSLVVAHYAPGTRNTASAPLHRLLRARAEGAVRPRDRYASGANPPLAWLADSPLVAVEQVPARPSTHRWIRPGEETPDLAAAPYDRVVDTTWRRTSYSGLTAGLHGHDAPEQAPADFRADEPEADQPVVPSGRRPEEVRGVEVGSEVDSEVASPFADQPAGAAFGTLVHAIFEAIDTDVTDLPGEVAAQVDDALSRRPFPGVTAGPLSDALVAAMTTPLGPLADGRALADLRRADRLPELDFELPLADGAGGRTLADVAALLRRHLPADDPLSGYADALAAQPLGSAILTGYLTGSIDAVLRVRAAAGPARHLVVDYKTNLLRDPSEPDVERLARGYRPSVLPAAMIGAHYPLQALLYCVALHRFLRWRQPDYDPAAHLGGVLYLFVRGMAGPGTPSRDGQVCGVFSWRPPARLIIELSDLLDGVMP